MRSKDQLMNLKHLDIWRGDKITVYMYVDTLIYMYTSSLTTCIYLIEDTVNQRLIDSSNQTTMYNTIQYNIIQSILSSHSPISSQISSNAQFIVSSTVQGSNTCTC